MNMLLSGNIESSTNQMSFMWLDWQDMITIVISVAALVLAVYQCFGDYRRKKRQDTLEAYNELQNDVFTPLNKLRKEYAELPIDNDFEMRSEVTGYLAKIERFCVGVNLKIYDIKTLKRCGGAYFVRQYLYLKPLIDIKKGRNNGGKHYDELEKVVSKLESMYKPEVISISHSLSDDSDVNENKDIP